MLRNKYRKANTASTLPFRFRNNFKRLPNRFSKSQDILSDNDGDETMLQEDFNDDNVDSEVHDNFEDSDNGDDNVDGEVHDNYEDSDNDDDSVDGEVHDNYESNGNDDDLEQQSNNDDDESDFNMIPTPLESEEENDYVMFLESDEDYATISSDSEEGYDADTSSEEKLFVDTALGEDKLPSFDGDFAPYFQDFTTAALFCWIHKHNISTNAYEDLIDIIMKPEFNRDHIVKNIRRFRTWRERLPLPSISAKSIPISSKKTPSTSKDLKMAYQLSISDIIWYVLNNPSIFKDMYFGPGVDSETKSEYWHGTLWAESPLFGQAQLTISGGNYIYLFSALNTKIPQIRGF
jgi:hypothetical protein